MCKRFGATVALDGTDLTVNSGEVHALVGENGAGKSTLVKVLSGAVRADAGEIRLDGERFLPRNPGHARQAGVAMIYQDLSLAPHLSVEENIVLGSEPTRAGFLRRGRMRQRALRALEQLNHPELRPDLPVGQLSVGARQLVEIARALVSGCRILVLDEPTSSLSRKDVDRLFELIRRLRAQGQAVVYISHFIEEVKRIADRFTVLRDGRAVGGGPADTMSVEEIVGMMVGRRIEQLYPRSHRRPGEPILEVNELAGLTGPDSVSFTLHRGEILGIAGLVGAGRTELLRALFGLDPVRKGRIRLGACVGPASPSRRLAQGMGMLSEDRKGEGLALSMSVADNLTLSRLEGFGRFGFVLRPRQEAAARHWVDELDIRCEDPRQQVWRLSGGNQQRLALARLLHHDVDVLLLDEPTRGIDVASKARIYRLIDDFVSRRTGPGGAPKAILMVSSYLPELLGVCDRIAVMCRGRLGPARVASELDEHQLMLEATGREIL